MGRSAWRMSRAKDMCRAPVEWDRIMTLRVVLERRASRKCEVSVLVQDVG